MVLKYYADMKDVHLSNLLRKANIKTDNQLMVFYDSSRQDCPENVRSIREYIIFYQCGLIDNVTHVPGPVSKSSAESEYNAACSAGMSLEHFRMLIHETFNKDPDIVPEESLLIILDRTSDVRMANNVNDTRHTKQISRRVNFLRNGEKCKIHKID